ncbi:hypothetical protein GCM10010191_12230 [Actinomadura vinacea]|uniref:Uncharacterized protein n=1 Tax=Actinomadura vinacea TaxID=115336 RepID=A0ABN3IJ22_9ACTN
MCECTSTGGMNPMVAASASDHQTHAWPRRHPQALNSVIATAAAISAPPKPARSCAMNDNSRGPAASSCSAEVRRKVRSLGTKTFVRPTTDTAAPPANSPIPVMIIRSWPSNALRRSGSGPSAMTVHRGRAGRRRMASTNIGKSVTVTAVCKGSTNPKARK